MINSLFLDLNPEIEYTILEVNRCKITDDKKTHKLRATLLFEEENQKYFIVRNANIQFGRQIRIGSTWKGNDVLRGADIELIELPVYFPKLYRRCMNSSDYLDEKSLHVGRYKFPEISEEKPFNQRICVYEVQDNPIDVNGSKYKFIIVPTYEIARFFTFGVNKYNELLLAGHFFEDNSKNTLFNPEKTGKFSEDGNDFKYIQLRKNIPDSCVKLAGDIFFIPEIKEIAHKISHKIQTQTELKEEYKNPFFVLHVPKLKYSLIKAYARIVYNKKGEIGLEVPSFAEIKYGDKYFYSRDNDGRTTPTRSNSMKKIFGGKRKNKPKNKINKPINHDSVSDPQMDAISMAEMIESNVFLDGDLSGEKRLKFSQEQIADDKKPGENVDTTGTGAMSGNGNSGTGTAPTDNDVNIGTNDITDKKYWEEFPTIMNILATRFSTSNILVKYLNNKLDFVSGPTKSSFDNVLETRDKSEFYLVRIEIGMNSFYIIELNAEEYNVPTMVFWDNFNMDKLSNKNLENFLENYYNQGGVPEQTAEDTSIFFDIGYQKIKHQYHPRGSEGRKRYSEEDALKNQADKIEKCILRQLFMD